MKKLIILPFIAILISLSVFATYGVTQNSPGEYYIMNDTDVVFNLTCSSREGGLSDFNYTLYTRNNRTADYSINFTGNITNQSSTNISLTVGDGNRIWWKVGCSDAIGKSITYEELAVVPTNNSMIDFANDTNALMSVYSWVNYTQPVINYSLVIPAQNQSVDLSMDVTDNYSIATTPTVVSTVHTLITNESVTMPSNASIIQLLYNESVMVVVNVTYHDGTELVTYGSDNYTLSAKSVTLSFYPGYNETGNETYWTYWYERNVTLSSPTDYSIINSTVYMRSNTYKDNTSYWNYEFYNKTTMTEGIDFNVTDGFVNMTMGNVDYSGDRSYWNYSWPGINNSNEVNSSVRIFDVDDYYYQFLTITVPIRLEGSTDAPTCDATSAGSIYYDTDDFKHYGCNATGWTAMYDG